MTSRTDPPTPHGRFDESVLLRYAETVQGAFQGAWDASAAPVERCYRMGGHLVLLRSPAARVLDKMGAALAHLRVEAPATPELTVCVWDSVDPTAPPGPPSPWGWYAERYADGRVPTLRFNAHGELTEFRSPRIYTAFRLRPHKLHVFDADRDLALYWTRDIDGIPDYEYCAPFRNILAWWMSSRAKQVVHAAAVGTADAGVLLAGKGGSGKSTTALACLGSALKFAGDDCCLIHCSEEPGVSSLYSSAKLKGESDVARFPRLAEALHNPTRPDGEKAFMFLHGHRPQFLSTGFPVRALLLPQVTGTSSPRLVPASSAQGLAALAPSSLRLFPGLERESTRRMADFVARVPVYRLEVGPDVRGIPDAILGLLERT